MKIIDITKTISHDTPTFPGDPHPTITRHKSDSVTKDGVFMSDLHLTTHSGTHIDAPAHVKLDATGMSSFPVEFIEGNARVMDIAWLKKFEPIANRPKKIESIGHDSRMLIFASKSKSEVFPRLQPWLADYIKHSGVTIIATDLLSIDQITDKHLYNHRLILGKDIWVAENLDLSNIECGFYRYIFAPMKTSAKDGAPARALLMKD